MASTITVPTTASLGGFATEVATNLATKGDYDSRIANAVVTLATEATTDVNALQARATALEAGTSIALVQPAALPGRARGVCLSNMSTSAFVGVTGGTAQNGVTYVAGEVVLFAAQTTTHQNGPWVVGTVAAGTAPLTRPSWWAAASAIPNGFVIEVSEGTEYKLSSWKATCTGAKVVGTDDPVFAPRIYKKTITLASGTYTVGAGSTATPDEALYLLAGADIKCELDTPGGTLTLTVGYGVPTASVTAGAILTAAAVVIARVAAGTIDTANNSTVRFIATNW